MGRSYRQLLYSGLKIRRQWCEPTSARHAEMVQAVSKYAWMHDAEMICMSLQTRHNENHVLNNVLEQRPHREGRCWQSVQLSAPPVASSCSRTRVCDTRQQDASSWQLTTSCSPIGRGNGLKIRQVRVRIPWGGPLMPVQPNGRGNCLKNSKVWVRIPSLVPPLIIVYLATARKVNRVLFGWVTYSQGCSPFRQFATVNDLKQLIGAAAAQITATQGPNAEIAEW